MNDSLRSMLGRIRAANRRRAAPAVELPALDEDAVRQVSPDADLPSLFAANARREGAAVEQIARADLPARIRMFIADHSVSTAVCQPEVRAEFPEIEPAINGVVVEPAHDDALFSADLGLTVVEAAIAETGMTVVTSGPGRPRGHSLVPPIHLALVRELQIVADLSDYLATIEGRQLPANITLIAGPSKTSDIEGQLARGMHGPGTVHILLIG